MYKDVKRNHEQSDTLDDQAPEMFRALHHPLYEYVIFMQKVLHFCIGFSVPGLIMKIWNLNQTDLVCNVHEECAEMHMKRHWISKGRCDIMLTLWRQQQDKHNTHVQICHPGSWNGYL